MPLSTALTSGSAEAAILSREGPKIISAASSRAIVFFIDDSSVIYKASSRIGPEALYGSSQPMEAMASPVWAT